MAATWFKFANPYTGTTNGVGAGTSLNDASGNWSTFDSLVSSNAAGQTIWVNSDAYRRPTTDMGNGVLHGIFNGRPAYGTRVRVYELGSSAAQSNPRMIYDTMSYTAQDNLGASTWTQYSGNIWQRTVGAYASSGYIYGLWACNGEVRGQYSGTRWELRMRASADACQTAGEFYAGSTSVASTSRTLYVNSGSSALNPDEVFGGLCFLWRDSSRQYALQYYGCQRIEWERLAILGGTLLVTNSGTYYPSQDVVHNSLAMLLPSETRAIHVTVDNSGANQLGPTTRIFFNDLLVDRPDANSMLARIDNEGAIGFDTVAVDGYVDDVRFASPRIYMPSGHGAMTVTCDTTYTPANETYPRNVQIYGRSRTDRGLIQGPRHATAAQCFSRLLQTQTRGNVVVRNMDILDNTIASQVSGKLVFDGCHFRGGPFWDGYDNLGNENKAGSNVLTFGEGHANSDIPTDTSLVVNSVIESTNGMWPVTLTYATSLVNDYSKLEFHHSLLINTSSDDKISRHTGGGVYDYCAPGVMHWRSYDNPGSYVYPPMVDCSIVSVTANVLTRSLWTTGDMVDTTYDLPAYNALNAGSNNNMMYTSLAAAGINNDLTISRGSPLRACGQGGPGTEDYFGNLRGARNTIGHAESA